MQLAIQDDFSSKYKPIPVIKIKEIDDSETEISAWIYCYNNQSNSYSDYLQLFELYKSFVDELKLIFDSVYIPENCNIEENAINYLLNLKSSLFDLTNNELFGFSIYIRNIKNSSINYSLSLGKKW